MIQPNHNKPVDILHTRPAMIRAARRAAEIAKQHGLPLILWRDGKIVEVMPDDLPPLPDIAPEANEESDHQ